MRARQNKDWCIFFCLSIEVHVCSEKYKSFSYLQNRVIKKVHIAFKLLCVDTWKKKVKIIDSNIFFIRIIIYVVSSSADRISFDFGWSNNITLVSSSFSLCFFCCMRRSNVCSLPFQFFSICRPLLVKRVFILRALAMDIIRSHMKSIFMNKAFNFRSDGDERPILKRWLIAAQSLLHTLVLFLSLVTRERMFARASIS